MNLPDVLTELGVPFKAFGEHRHTTPGRIQIDCPWCDAPEHFRYGIRLVGKLSGSCWSCGWHRVGYTLAELSGRSIAEVMRLLGDVEETFPSGTETRPSGKLALPEGLGPLGTAHRLYLKQRGFDPDELEEVWGLRGIGLCRRLAWRVWLPVTDRDGKTASWTTRGLTDAEPRYVNARPEEEAKPIKSLLFGEHLCQHTVIVCEGPFDAMRIGPGAVATFGLNVTEAQLARIIRFPRRIVCFDNEPTAQRMAEKLRADLRFFPGSTGLMTVAGKDVASTLTRKDVRKLRKQLLT